MTDPHDRAFTANPTRHTVDRMRILLVSPLPPPPGGIAQWTMRLQDQLARSEIDITILDTAVRNRLQHDLRLSSRAVAGLVQTVRVLPALLATRFRFKPHALHINTSGGLGLMRDILLLSAARVLKTPTALHLRFGRAKSIAEKSGWEWRLLRTAVRLSQAVIVLDKATMNTIGHLKSAPVRQIPNFLADPAIEPAFPVTRTVTFVGRISFEKGIEELLEAWEHAQLDGWHLQLIGPGDPKYIDNLAQSHPWVAGSLIGELPNMAALDALSRSAIFILPSHTEGFPNVLCEAMAVGCGVIGTRVGAIPEMLAENAGIVVSPGNSSELSAALRNMTQDTDWEAYGRRARKRFLENYEAHVVIRQYAELWQQLSSGTISHAWDVHA